MDLSIHQSRERFVCEVGRTPAFTRLEIYCRKKMCLPFLTTKECRTAKRQNKEKSLEEDCKRRLISPKTVSVVRLGASISVCVFVYHESQAPIPLYNSILLSIYMEGKVNLNFLALHLDSFCFGLSFPRTSFLNPLQLHKSN